MELYAVQFYYSDGECTVSDFYDDISPARTELRRLEKEDPEGYGLVLTRDVIYLKS